MSSFITPIQPIKPIISSMGKSDSAGTQGSAIPFADMLKEAMTEYDTLSQQSDEDGNALAVGSVDNLAQIQIDSMKAQAALQTTVQLTSRMVSAYKEIMQMQI